MGGEANYDWTRNQFLLPRGCIPARQLAMGGGKTKKMKGLYAVERNNPGYSWNGEHRAAK
jgi:hypothetical protein